MNKRNIVVILLSSLAIEAFLWIMVGVFGKVGADDFNRLVTCFLWAHIGAMLIDPDPAGYGSFFIYSISGFAQWVIIMIIAVYGRKKLQKLE
jgi:hypothetical protein